MTFTSPGIQRSFTLSCKENIYISLSYRNYIPFRVTMCPVSLGLSLGVDETTLPETVGTDNCTRLVVCIIETVYSTCL